VSEDGNKFVHAHADLASGFRWGPAIVERLMESAETVYVQIQSDRGFVVVAIGIDGRITVCNERGKPIADGSQKGPVPSVDD